MPDRESIAEASAALDSLCADEHHTWRLKVCAALGVPVDTSAEDAIAVIASAMQQAVDAIHALGQQAVAVITARNPRQLVLDGCDCSGARADIDGND